MQKTLLRICSMLLVIIMVINLLPMQSFATEFTAIQETELNTEPEAEESAEGQIVEEIIEDRTEYIKTFRMNGGLYMAAVYPEPVHYEKDGQWEDIDNTLKTRLDGTYANTAGVWDVRFPNQLTSSSRISVTKDTYTLSFGMAGELRQSGDLEIMSGEAALQAASAGTAAETFAVSQAQASTAQLQQVDVQKLKEAVRHEALITEKLYAGLLYKNVYTNTDIRYDLNSNKVKESVILESHSSTLRGYRYALEVGDLNPVLQSDGSIYFYDHTQEQIVMVMEAPFLVDAAMAHSFDVQVQLSGSGSSYTLTYLLPTQWLASSERQWPVVLDPVITAELSHSNIRDVTVTEKYGSRYLEGMIECGYGQQDGIQRIFLKYSSIPSLSSSDVVISAVMQMCKFASDTTATVQVHKVLGTWESESITWANKPNFDTTIEDYAIAQAAGWYAWDVTDIVRGWYAGDNTGMMFKVDDAVEAAQTNNWKQFYSSDYSDSTTYMPSLTICYRNNNGLESYWDYTGSSAGRAGTGYINNYTGNLVWVREDMGFGGNRMPVNIQHVYNANDNKHNRFGLGYGWRTNYNQIIKWSNMISGYVWEDPDGTEHYFNRVSTGTYKDEDGLELTFSTIGGGKRQYNITDKYGNISYFDTTGRLTFQQNNQATSSSVSITYTDETGNCISTITDGAGRVYSFSYSDGLLTRISYLGSGSTELSYVSFGYSGSQMVSVTNKDSEVCSYSYNANNLLTTAQDVDGYKLSYSYNILAEGKPARVSRVTETHNDANGGELSIEYAHNQTTFTDVSGNVQIMQFNNLGNTVSIQDGEGRAQYTQYAKNDAAEAGKGNQLTMSSKLQNTVGNLLRDNSFETGVFWYPTSYIDMSCSAEAAYVGNYSMKLVCNMENTSAYGACSHAFYVEDGQTVTFSAYVKTVDAAARIAVHCYDNNTGENFMSVTPMIAAGQDWHRNEISFTNTTGRTLRMWVYLIVPNVGTVYLDGVQVELAHTASRYNLIDNGDFRHNTYNWSNTGGYAAATVTAAAPELSSSVYGITGSPTAQKRMSQTVAVSGGEGDTFVLAGWAKGDSVPLTGNRQFAIIGTFHYTDGDTADFTAQFNPATNSAEDWQYSAANMVATKAYNSITVQLAYDYNANTVYFDGIQLYKEEFGNSYTYDDKGNVTSVVDLQEQRTDYEYDTNSNLTKILQDNKAKMTYTYDDHHNVLTATSEEGIVYSFTYDTYGNNTAVSIGSGSSKITATATYSTDGNRLVSTTDALGKTTTYDYDANTNVLNWVKYPEDTDATRTNYTYDNMYRIATAAATTDTGKSLTASYTYADDLLTKLQTGSTTYNFTYGNFALRSNIKVGSRTLASYSYADRTNYLTALDYGNGPADESLRDFCVFKNIII